MKSKINNNAAPQAKKLCGAMKRAALVLLLAVFSVATASAQLTPDGYSHTVLYRMSTVGEGSESVQTHWNTGETAHFFRNENGWQDNAQTQWGRVEYLYITSFNKTNNGQSASFVFTPSNYDPAINIPAINIAVSWNSPTTTFNLLQYHDWEYSHVSGSMQHDEYYITKVAGMFRGADTDAEWTVTIQSLDATQKITSVEFINKEGETKFSASNLFTTTYTSPSLTNATMGETDNNDNRNGVHQIKVTFSDIPSAPWSGVGTEANPFIIHTVQDLQNLASQVNNGTPYDGYYFAQDADIDCDGHSLTTIGYDRDARFGGIYNGQNFAIRNYSSWNDNPIYVYPYRALFGNVSGASNGSRAELKNIVMENCNIARHNNSSSVTFYVAGICAYPNNATISNCHVTGTLNGQGYTGGIVGYTEHASVSNCFADVSITSTTGSNGNIYGYTTTHVTTSACYYRDHGNGIGGCGNSSISYSASEIAPVYSVTTGAEVLTVAETNASVTHNGTRYFVSGTTATLNASDNYYIIGTPTVSGTGASLGSVASDRKSMTVNVGSGDVSVTATLQQIPWSGNGSSQFPYIIHTVSDLQDLATFVNTGIAFDGYYFKQDADIDCSSSGMAPIGNLNNLFKGNYNGNNKKIISYHLDQAYLFSALFGPTEGATLTNIVMQNCNIDASSYNAEYASAAGICISCTSGTTISNCRVTGTIKGRLVAGGIVGTIGDANTISDCFADVTLTVVDANGKRGKIYGATTVHPTTSACYYHDNGDGVEGCGYNESGTPYSDTEIAPVYALTASNGLTLAATNVAVTHNGTRYFVSGANATLNVSDNNYSIVGTPTVSGTGATYTLAADRKSMTVTVGSADVTVTATLGTTQGSCGTNATWSLADNDNNGTFETLTISGTGAVQNYSQANPAPWGNAITIANVGDGITGIGDYAFANCSSLQRVNINNSGTVSIGSNTFSGCTALQYIVFPSIAAEQQNITGNWEAYATKRRAQFGSQHFAVTTETGTAVYAIATEQDLRNLSTAVNGGNNGSGQTFRQTADITLNGSFTPIGNYISASSIRKFSGTYDGGDNTISGLTISGNHQYAGLFGQVDTGGTVKNVRLVNPSVTSSFSGANVAALIGGADRCTVQNCLVVNPTVSATASSSNNNVGVLFGYLSNGTVQNCIVISPTVSGEGTNYVGVICGYAQNGGTDYHCTLTNVYYYNSSLSAIGVNTNGEYSSLTNVGPVRKVTLGSGMANVSPEATNMANGFVYDNETYYREGLTLTLTDNLGTTSEGYTKHYYANGTDLNGSTYTVNSTDGDVTFTAACRSDNQSYEVTYVDANGTEHSTSAIPLDGTMTTLNGTYYVGANITFTSTITLNGNTTLILVNGKTMNVGTSDNRISGEGIKDYEYKRYTLTIYGQSLDEATAGHLNIYNSGSDGIYLANYNQQSGNVTVNSTTGNYTINCDYFTLSGGKLNAINNHTYGTSIFGNQQILILGGQLDTYVSNNNERALTSFKSITLGWTNATDHIYADTYYGTVNIASGQVFVTNDPTPDTITGNNIDISRINGKTLRPILTGSGTTDDPYLISNAGCWDLFCDLIENSTYTFTGNVKLCANISVSRMAGSESKPFCGHFDGQNNTLTFNYNTGNDPILDYIAPFRYVKGSIGNAYHHATISNLYVDSHIIGENATHLAGLIANQKGLVDVTNCHVQAAITSTATTDSYCAGLVSHADLSDNYGNANDGTLTISGCTVSGSIVTYGKYTGGFVGMAEGKTSIVNSVSGVTINSIVSGNGTHGGFIGLQQHTMNYTGVKTTIEGCLFNGKLITSNGTTNCGGFIGWHDGGSLEIKHCLYAPADLDSGETEISDGSTFVGNGTVGFNCIYTRALGTAQGKASRSIIAGEYVTISNIALINFLSNPDVYNVSGITSYDWGGINCGGDLYFCEGAHVSLVLSNNCPDPAPAGSVYGYTASGGTLEKNGNGTYTLTMPNADVTIDATIMQPSEVSYIDEHGMEQTVTALPLTGSETILDPGWYVVENTNPNGVDLAYTEGLSCSDGNLNLILCDGAEMTVTGAYSYDAITLDGESTLTIYGQSQQSGKLTLTGSEYGKCIQTNDGNIVINGGIVNATADTDGAIKCNSFTMNGGSFSATSNSSYDYDHAIQISDSFTFNGGNFSAIATNPGQFGIEGAWSSVNLSWTNTSDSFYVSSLGQVNIIIAEGKDFIDDEDNIHTSDEPGDIAGKTLRPFNGYYSPKNLTVTGITLSSAMLTWEAGNNETQWQVSWSTDGGSTWSDPVTVNNEPQYEITNLNPETTVQVQVKSIYSEGQSFPTSITFTTRSLCDAPENLTTAPIASSATLNWTGYQDSYNVRYCELTVGDAVTTTEDFEHDGEMPEGWTKLDLGDGENTAELGVSTDAAQNGGSYGFRFSSFNGDNSEGSFDQYLISPELYDITALSFYYRASSTSSSGETFRVGYSTTTNDVSAFTWVSNGSTSSTDFSEFVEDASNIPANAKYFAINYTAVWQYYLYIDDITYTCRPFIAGAWNETNTNVTSPLTISGLTSETQYAWQVQGINADCDGGLTDWSEIGTFATLSLPPVSYIDENGQQQLRTKYVTLNGTETTLGTTGQETWYVADSTLDYSQTITLNGDVHLILKDNATMTVSGGYINGCVPNPNYGAPEPAYDLNIYGQSTGNDRGSLTVKGSGQAIYCNSITINGGKVTATSGHFMAVAIEANNVTINGGQVIANAGSLFGISASNITLGWQNMNDYIFATRYNGNIAIATGKAFIDVEGNTYSGSGITGIDGKTLYPDCVVMKQVEGYEDGDDGWVLIASPVSGSIAPSEVHNLIATSDEDYDLFRFNQSNVNGKEWENIKATTEQNHSDFTGLVNGQGYLYATRETKTLVFAGEFNNASSQEVSLDYEANAEFSGWNLVGNPFATTAILDQPYYRMNAEGSALQTETETSEVTAIEGVFVQASGEDQTVTFTAQPARTRGGEKAAIAQANIMVVGDNGTFVDNAIVRFDGGQTLEKFSFREGNTKVYIPQGGKDYAIVTSEGQGEIPVNFKAVENGSYTLSFNSENVAFDYLHLIDNMTGNDVDVLVTPSYSFEARTTDYESRFKLVFATGNSSNDDSFAFFSNGNWIINNEGRATLQVIDINGRILSSESVNGNVSKAIHGAPGVYMLRLINGDDVKVQKIVID